jgi:hypothetical protein
LKEKGIEKEIKNNQIPFERKGKRKENKIYFYPF